MRLLKNKERRIAKQMARQMSMTGWRGQKEMEKQKQAESRNHQRWTSLGIGHHMARMMKGHI